jgi:hypothetical protein
MMDHVMIVNFIMLTDIFLSTCMVREEIVNLVKDPRVKIVLVGKLQKDTNITVHTINIQITHVISANTNN